MSNSTYHGVVNWLGELLQPLHKMVVNHSVKDVFEFIANADDINVNGKQMLSLDVASLFTNVPLMETVEFICQQTLRKQFDIGIPVISLKSCFYDVLWMYPSHSTTFTTDKSTALPWVLHWGYFWQISFLLRLKMVH
uniref:Uncharacterized protein n=1 Tax=Trichobilharzia regenti TaxID=157069 RepID=A0AA85JUN1_TRIRE|nr:unnamed protein product [Trichobilharzia regenti]